MTMSFSYQNVIEYIHLIICDRPTIKEQRLHLLIQVFLGKPVCSMIYDFPASQSKEFHFLAGQEY